MNDINKRINEIAELYFNGNNSLFAKKVDTNETNIRNYRKNTMPKVDFIIKLSELLEINFDWILTGLGEMKKPLSNKMINDSKCIGSEDLRVIKSSNRKTTDSVVINQEIPLYNLEATAGLKQLFDSGGPREVLDTIKIPNLPKCDGAITVSGDSMYPLLKSGDIVLYRQTTVENIFFGEMYLLSVSLDDWEEYITVKYVQRSELGADYVKLVSQNSHHQSKDILINKITALALVKASIRINTML